MFKNEQYKERGITQPGEGIGVCDRIGCNGEIGWNNDLLETERVPDLISKVE